MVLQKSLRSLKRLKCSLRMYQGSEEGASSPREDSNGPGDGFTGPGEEPNGP